MNINCPKCLDELIIPDGIDPNRHLQCPTCGQKFTFRNLDKIPTITKVAFVWLRIFYLIMIVFSTFNLLISSYDKISYSISLTICILLYCLTCGAQRRHVLYYRILMVSALLLLVIEFLILIALNNNDILTWFLAKSLHWVPIVFLFSNASRDWIHNRPSIRLL